MTKSTNNLGVAMVGGGGKKRPADDHYATPNEAVFALLFAVDHMVGRVVHEPCCGDGRMARAIEAFGHEVIATNLADRGYGIVGQDFLKNPLRAPSVISNPPFAIAADFIAHGCSQNPDFFALLLKQTFWNAAKRIYLWERYPPRLILPLTFRLDFTGEGAPTMDVMWNVWGSRVPVGLHMELLRKPVMGVFQ
jgi:hypothetical protein